MLPFIETYWITIAYFAVLQNRKLAHDEENLYQKIQWLLETFYSEGLLKFYESCMLESIKNAVKKFTSMGILTLEKRQIKKTVFKTYIHVSKDFQDETKIADFFDSIAFYLPYCVNANLDYFQREMKKLTVSEI